MTKVVCNKIYCWINKILQGHSCVLELEQDKIYDEKVWEFTFSIFMIVNENLYNFTLFFYFWVCKETKNQVWMGIAICKIQFQHFVHRNLLKCKLIMMPVPNLNVKCSTTYIVWNWKVNTQYFSDEIEKFKFYEYSLCMDGKIWKICWINVWLVY